MKPFIISMMLCVLAGCAQQSHFPPDVSGQLRPINSTTVMQEINHV